MKKVQANRGRTPRIGQESGSAPIGMTGIAARLRRRRVYDRTQLTGLRAHRRAFGTNWLKEDLLVPTITPSDVRGRQAAAGNGRRCGIAALNFPKAIKNGVRIARWVTETSRRLLIGRLLKPGKEFEILRAIR